MNNRAEYPLFESRSARCNATVKSPARWRLLAELFMAPAERLHRYRDFSRRVVEETLTNADCRRTCQ
ncbi:MAG: hypothetical protein AAFN50_01575 [Pseudomonadota bacterium]